MGANPGATWANDVPRQAGDYGYAADNPASSRTDPDDLERGTGTYRPESWRFESPQLHPCAHIGSDHRL